MSKKTYAPGLGKLKKGKYSTRVKIKQTLRPGGDPINRAQRRAMTAIERKGGANNDQNRQPYPVPGRG